MNFLKVKFGLFSLLAILAVSVFLTSCEQNAIDIPDVMESGADESISFKYSKDVQISSENNLNKVTLTISGSDESLLSAVNPADFKVIPIFEKPAESSNDKNYDVSKAESYDVSNNTEAPQDDMSVAFSVGDVELEEGAIGYKIEVRPTNNEKSSYSSHFWVSPYSYRDTVVLNRVRGCFTGYIYKQQYPNSNWKWSGSGYDCNSTTVFVGNGQYYRTAAYVYWQNNQHNPQYEITFY